MARRFLVDAELPELSADDPKVSAWARDSLGPYISQLFEQVKLIMRGAQNNCGSVTLTANQTTTTVDNVNFESSMCVFLMPTTANASAEFGNGTIYVSARTNKQFTITHANNAQADRTFFYTFGG